MRGVRPSYQQGYARNASESENPGSWSGLVGAWVPTLGPTGSTLRDISGYGNHGTLTLMDPATDWVIGGNPRIPGYALDFDGDNDHVRLGTNQLAWSDSSFSILVWIYPRALTLQSVVHLGNDSDNTEIEMRFRGNGKFEVLYYNGTTFGLFDGNGGTEPPLNQWSYVAGTFNKDTGEWNYYLNGIPDKTVTDDVAIDLGNGIDNLIGALNTFPQRNFNAIISNVHIYNRTLTADEIWQDYNDPLAMFRRRMLPFFVPTVAANPPIVPGEVPHHWGRSSATAGSAFDHLWTTNTDVDADVEPSASVTFSSATGTSTIPLNDTVDSAVLDLQNTKTKQLTLNRDLASGNAPTLQVRGQSATFNRADASPSWQSYTVGMEVVWRYWQARFIGQ